jgi:3-phosphoshikimate 1-carboxyvinyltransferase
MDAVAALSLPLDRLPDPLPIPVLTRPFHASVRPPGSKSLTNRALLLAALAEGESVLHGALTEAEDARVMVRALEHLGARVRIDGAEVHVHGVGGRWRVPAAGVELHLENAGTATRFLTAAALLADPSGGPVVIDGNSRMRERPIGELVELVRALGARAEYVGREGFPPVRVFPAAPGALGESLSVGLTASSQFVSALLLVGAFLPRGLDVRFTGEPTSRSYLDMTVRLLSELGVRVDTTGIRAGGSVRVWPTRLYRFEHEVEPDASGATYFWAAAAISPGSSCLVRGMGAGSMQGDARFVDVLRDMGAVVETDGDGIRVRAPGAGLHALSADLTLMPDAAMTLAAACCFAPGPSLIAGLRTLRVKETDRLAALVAELAKIGVGAGVRDTEGTGGAPDEALGLRVSAGGIDCSPDVPRVEFDTYRDHRMAMALALIGLRRPNVYVRDPGCVAKTYPTFWRDLSSLYITP